MTRNKPYAGGFITEHYGNPAHGCHAIQIEINRGLYMDERRLEKSPRIRTVRDLTMIGDHGPLGSEAHGILWRPIARRPNSDALKEKAAQLCQRPSLGRKRPRRAVWTRNHVAPHQYASAPHKAQVLHG